MEWKQANKKPRSGRSELEQDCAHGCLSWWSQTIERVIVDTFQQAISQ